MGKIAEGFIIEAVHGRSFKPGDRLVEFGDSAFATTDTSVEVSTNITTTPLEFLSLTIKDVTPVANDLLGSDGVISSGAFTVARPAGTTSALGFWWMAIGQRSADV